MADPVVIPQWASLVLVGALALLTGFFTILSALIERSGPIRLRHWAEAAGGSLQILYDQPARFEAFRFLLSLAAGLCPVLLVLAAASFGVTGGWVSAVALGAGLLFVLEWGNRSLVAIHSERALELLTLPVRLLSWLSQPLVLFLSFLLRIEEEDDDEEEEDEVSIGEIKAYIDVGVKEGILEPEEEELVRSIVDFGDTQARSVMTPRVEMSSVPVDATSEALCEAFVESKHARLPVYRDSVDHIVGILHIRDLFEAIHTGAEPVAEELAKTPLYVPESKSLPELLAELQNRHQEMAIVVDEYGGVAGLVTVEDLVEEIVGDISDEHDTSGIYPVVIDEHSWKLPGRTYLETLEEVTGAEVEKLPYETVSGLICGELGYVPKVGETIERYGLTFDIAEANERRVTAVVVRRAPVGEQSVEAAQ